MANQRLYGSLNFSALFAAAKAGHSAFKKADNGVVYCNITQWINEKKDDKGNDSSITLSSKKEMQATEKKVYIANLKKAEAGGADSANLPVSGSDLAENLDDLPF